MELRFNRFVNRIEIMKLKRLHSATIVYKVESRIVPFERLTFVFSTIGYIDDKYYFGCTVGRVTNRIKNACFQLDGTEYRLERNDQGKHHLHGVFNKRIWTSEIENDDTIVFRYRSPDGKC